MLKLKNKEGKMTNYGSAITVKSADMVYMPLEREIRRLYAVERRCRVLSQKPLTRGKKSVLPVIVAEGESTVIKLGSVPHPMTEGHVHFVEILKKDGKSQNVQA